MKLVRSGYFTGQNMSDEAIREKVKLIVGQGAWTITYHVSGSVISWRAEGFRA